MTGQKCTHPPSNSSTATTFGLWDISFPPFPGLLRKHCFKKQPMMSALVLSPHCSVKLHFSGGKEGEMILFFSVLKQRPRKKYWWKLSLSYFCLCFFFLIMLIYRKTSQRWFICTEIMIPKAASVVSEIAPFKDKRVWCGLKIWVISFFHSF